MVNCPLCKKANADTVHHEKWLADDNVKFMICKNCHGVINRYYQYLEHNYEFKYGIGKYKKIDNVKEIQESQN